MYINTWDSRTADMLIIARNFVEEVTHDGIEYDPDIAVQTLWDCLHNPDCQIILEYVNEEIAGGCIIYRNRCFTNRYFGFMDKFYVLPKFRGTRTARNLMAQAVDWFDKNKCIVSYTGSDARLNGDKMFHNLVNKFGYESKQSYTREGK